MTIINVPQILFTNLHKEIKIFHTGYALYKLKEGDRHSSLMLIELIHCITWHGDWCPPFT